MQETKKFKKRKRLARPKTLVFIGILFLLLPFINYLAATDLKGIKLTSPLLFLMGVDPAALILIFLPLPVGIGLLRVRKWGWWLFLVYMTLLIPYNLFVFFDAPGLYNAGGVLQALLGCGAIFYFTHKDISAPYVKMYPRGWRGEKRKPLELEVTIGDIVKKTRDITLDGFYVDWPEAPFEPNADVIVSLDLADGKFELEAGVVRIDQNGIGVAFRGMDGETSHSLKAALHE